MKSKLSVIWLLSYISIASVSAAIITPALPEIQRQFALNVGEVEWIVSAFLIGYVVGQLIYGPLANAYGRLKALRFGLVINLVGLCICLLAIYWHLFYGLVIGRLITGLGAASGLACTFMLMNEWLPEAQRKGAMASSILSFALGIGLSVMIGGIITQYWQWQACFIFLMLQGLLMLFGTAVFSETLSQPKAISVHGLLQDYAHALTSSKLVIFSLVVGTCSMVGYCFSAAAPQIAQDYLHINAAEYGYWNSFNIMGMLIGGISAKMLLQRVSAYQIIYLGLAGCILTTVSLVWMWYFHSTSILWFFINSLLLYWFAGYLFAGGSLIASNAIPDKASASSMMSFVNMGFATLSVIVMGYLSSNPFTAFIAILSFVFLSILGLLSITKYQHR